MKRSRVKGRGESGHDAHSHLVEMRQVGKAFVGRKGVLNWIVRDITLSVDSREFLTIVGPSGSGKTTLLRLVAGILPCTEGSLEFEGRAIIGPSRDRVMVFQSASTVLFEWLNARDNVAFGLRTLGMSKASGTALAEEMLSLVGLAAHGEKYPSQLSGGMQQRLQIARALAVAPKVLLMDEPLAALDAQTRRILLKELVSLWERLQTAFIYVTHDIREAIFLGQRIAVFTNGPSATIKSVYANSLPYPRDEFSDQFIALYKQIDGELSAEVGESL